MVGARHTGSSVFETGGWITKDGAINKKRAVSGDCESDNVDVGAQNRTAGMVQVMKQDTYEQKPAQDGSGAQKTMQKDGFVENKNVMVKLGYGGQNETVEKW